MKKILPFLIIATIVLLVSCNNRVHTVRFNTSGGTPVPSRQRVNDGGKAIAPNENPVREGYIFAFWHLDGAPLAYDFQTPVTGDITLYSKWLPVPDDIFTVMEDDNFRNICQIFDTNKDGRLSPEEAAAVTKLEILDIGAKSLAGIEYFTSLTYLDCSHNELQNIDLSANVNLEYLNCEWCKAERLNISANTALKEIYCSYNYLYFLDVSGKKNLKKLDCSWTNLKSLEVSGCTALEELNCGYNALSALDLSSTKTLKTLDCHSNQLADLNVEGCTALNTIECSQNALSEVEISTCTSLEVFNGSYNQIIRLDVSGNSNLKSLTLRGNNLTDIELSATALLEELDCSYNQLTDLDISSNVFLKSLHCDGNPNISKIKVWNGFDIDNPSNSIQQIEKDGHTIFVVAQ